MNEYDYEHSFGLPYKLDADESVIWQGQPSWRALAVHLCHIRFLVGYFVILMGWRLLAAQADGRLLSDAYETIAWLSVLLGVLCAILLLFAWGVGKTTVYTITTKRVVFRFGIAITKAVNVPLRIIGSAGLRKHGASTGDITLMLSGDDKIAYLLLWPHVRPWKLSRPQPMLRAVREPDHVATLLKDAVATRLQALNDDITLSETSMQAELHKQALKTNNINVSAAA